MYTTQLTLWHLTETLVRAHEMERATEDVQYFGERLGGSRRYRIPYLRALAVLAQYHGEFASAVEHLIYEVPCIHALVLPVFLRVSFI